MRIEHGLLHGHVLQRTLRGATVVVRGTCTGSGAITARVMSGTKALRGWSAIKVGTAAKGTFTATLRGIPTGGPYTVELTVGREKVMVREIFVGDLWLMAGQSNMQGIGNLEDAPEPHPMVRNFTMGREWELACDPLHCLHESPDTVHNASGVVPTPSQRKQQRKKERKGTGVGVYFGRLMHERSGVPQGLIATAHGGTSMAQWDPALRDHAGASLYGSMLLSVRAVGQPIAGVLWYQGESDATAEAAPLYTRNMEQLVAAIRTDCGQPRLPIVVVQIGRHVVPPLPHIDPWNAIQDQQRALPTTISHCDVVSVIDLELDDGIHVSGKAYGQLAQRMALSAARLCRIGTDRSQKSTAIVPISVGIVDGVGSSAIEVRFAQVVGGLHAQGLPRGFALVDDQGRILDEIFKTELLGDRVRLHLTGDVPRGAQLFYGHGRNPVCTIVDGRGVALLVFGPLPIPYKSALSPWFVTWRSSSIRPGEDISGLTAVTALASAAPFAHRAFGTQPGLHHFVNEHERWKESTGHQVFTTDFILDEAMALELRLGYDGPIRVWLDKQEVFADLNGSNPAIFDARKVPMRLKPRTYTITVAMALNRGAAWGFFLRFARTDLSKQQVASGTYTLPQPVVSI